jgi:succinoglycan biosynthesis transport protein ExoP
MPPIQPVNSLQSVSRGVGGILLEHRILFGSSWLFVAVSAVIYAFCAPQLWPITTSLSMREETGLSHARPGEFASTDARRKSQETVLQLSSSTSVIRAALSRALKDSAVRPLAALEISIDEIEKTQQRIRLTPPKGVDWGASEIFFLTIKDEDVVRGVALSKSLIEEIDLRLRELRRKRGDSLIRELEQSLQLAEEDLRAAMEKMSALEASLGHDLAEMRIMTEPSSGESNLRRTLTEVAAELRQTRSQIDSNQTLLDLLDAARSDPSRLIATPGRLLDSQPSLRKLKEGIVDAENRTSQLRGNLHASHPKVKAAMAIEQQSRRQLFTELALAAEGVKVEIQVGRERLAELESRQDEIEQRLSRLASLRAEYGLLASQVKDRGEVVKRTREQVSEVRASRAAAETVSVLTSVEEPLVGLRTDGPRKLAICLMGVLGGLVLAILTIIALAPSSRWRGILESVQGETESIDPPVEHGVLAAWLGRVERSSGMPHRERLSSNAESSLPTRQ